MQIKGTAVKVTQEYVNHFFPEKYNAWFDNLPEKSKQIFEKAIFPNQWYDLMDAVIIPTMEVSKMFFDRNDEKAAFELGRYSAETALKGIYKIFLRVSSPQFVISRATNIFDTYYTPAVIQIDEKSDKGMSIRLEGFDKENILIMKRIEGWIAKTLELVAKKEIHTHLRIEQGDELVCFLSAQWND